ncbi:hypothetical protein [Pleionea sediminis]|uniref:hypothetical protein n=1 Tax=Pleionea sediminis TaxID=2569479 RepID=UPI0011861E04|nr:hypothetical protein [Pleionea sediminis]
MKRAGYILVSWMLVLSTYSNAKDSGQELSDTVNSFMIESYNFVLNINLLIELCTLDSYLEINTNSKAFNDKLHENIATFAKYGKIKDYSANKVAAEVEIKFTSFLQGVRYGGFIADNFIKTQYPKGVCTDEIKKDLNNRINELVQKDEFLLTGPE